MNGRGERGRRKKLNKRNTFLSLLFQLDSSSTGMESDGEELDYDFDTPQKPNRVSNSKQLTASADKKNPEQKRREGEGAAAKATNADIDGNKRAKKPNDDQDVEEELYGDIVSPGGAGAGDTISPYSSSSTS